MWAINNSIPSYSISVEMWKHLLVSIISISGPRESNKTRALRNLWMKTDFIQSIDSTKLNRRQNENEILTSGINNK